MKLVHISLTALVATTCMLGTILPAQEAKAPPYGVSYDPAKGFKPVQRSLTDIFLQLVGSLEHHGSPAPYLRHIQAEERRIAPQFKLKTGRDMPSYRPAYMTDEYIDNLISNWELLSPKLRLNTLAQDAGMCARKAILGPNGTGTVLIDLINYYQKAVIADMRGGPLAEFESLRKLLSAELEFDKPLNDSAGKTKLLPQAEQTLVILVEHEKALSAPEQKEYAGFLRMPRFTRAQFGQLERFYKGPYDKLTEGGKSQMSRRVMDGTRADPPNPRLDALKPAQDFRGQLDDLFSVMDSSLEKKQSEKLKAVIISTFLDLGQIAQTELELGLVRFALEN